MVKVVVINLDLLGLFKSSPRTIQDVLDTRHITYSTLYQGIQRLVAIKCLEKTGRRVKDSFEYQLTDWGKAVLATYE